MATERLAAGPGTARITADATTPAPEPEPALDLHADIRELLRRLSDADGRGDVLDAYLYLCGIAQLIEDWAYGTDWRTRQLAALLGPDRRAGRLVRRCADILTAPRRILPGGRRALRVRALALELMACLATEVLGGVSDSSPSHVERIGPGERSERIVRSGLGRLPASLREQVLRPPSSFRSFDQHPQDMVALAQRFALRYPDRDVPLLVVGVRTSGGYLAPLTAAALGALGYRCEFASTRNGEPLPGAALRRTRTRDGIVLVVDDPPSSGSALAGTARAVCAFGFAAERVVPMFAGFDSAASPPALAGFRCVVLPPADWHIRTLLGPTALRSRVQAAFPGRELVDLRAEEPATPTREAHLAVRLSADLRDASGEIERIALVSEGAGQGYLGRHALAVAARLPGWVPRVYAFDDGTVLREDGAGQPGAAPAETSIGYAAARQARLPLGRDRSAALQGRQPVWEIGARLLAHGFGRLAPLARPLLIDPPLRSMLRSPSPCLVDGRTALPSWAASRPPGPNPIKTDFDDGCFSHLDLAVYDAAYDLAGAAVCESAGDRVDPRRLLEGFERATGRSVDPAAWCVYQLVQAWNLERIGGRPAAGGARAVQAFLGRLFLDDLPDEPDGPWCALDVDGVLELDFGGMPVSTFAAMRALRALRAHGFRVLLATGRSGPDVRDRCLAYRLAGGAAEYGSVLCDARTGTLTATAPADPRRNALLQDLAALGSVRLDPDYQCCVRASALRAGSSRRTGLDEATARRIAAAHPSFTQVQGHAQTDFLPEGTDKAHGISTLIDRFGAGEVALAVGDTKFDISLLRMARLGLAPGHASKRVGARTRAPYQAGLAQAVARLLGHRPGSCASCRVPRLTPADELVLTLLSVAESGRRGMPLAAARLAYLRASRATRRRDASPWE